jgi:hypothetical protein
MTPGKIAANRGVPRNKKPLQNIILWIEDAKSLPDGTKQFALLWAYERDYNQGRSKNFSCVKTLPLMEAYLKDKLTPGQWAKFRNGARQFVIQRRINGRNVPKKSGA